MTTAVDLAVARQLTEIYLEEGIPTFWWGPPGVGKSEVVHQIARDRKGGLVDFRAILRDTVDMRGVPMPDLKSGTTKWLPPDELPNEKRDGKTGILFLDELNAAHPQVQAACFGLVLDRKLGDYRLPDGWQIIAAGNRQSDRSAAQRMPRALANRFAHIEVEANAEVWIRDYGNFHCDPVVTGFIHYRKELIHKMDVDDERKFPTPRAWERVSRAYQRLPNHLLFSGVEALVGEGPAAEFVGFVKTYRDLPDLDDIISKPTKAPVPEEPSALYAVASALSRMATRDNIGNIMTYAQRFPEPEYEIVVMMDATSRDAAITKTKAYGEFVVRHKNVQIGRVAA